MKNKMIIYIASAVALIGFFVAGSIFYKKSKNESYSFLVDQNFKIFVRDYSPRFGHPDAPVVVVEFLDPECESCRLMYPQVKELLKAFGEKVQLVVRYAPFHQNSMVAIMAIEAARLQGKYWESLELLFEKQPEWGNHHNPKPEMIFTYLPNLNLDMDKLKKDMNNADIQNNIKQDIIDLKELNIRGTPTFFVNGKPLDGFGIQYLREKIQKELQKL